MPVLFPLVCSCAFGSFLAGIAAVQLVRTVGVKCITAASAKLHDGFSFMQRPCTAAPSVKGCRPDHLCCAPIARGARSAMAFHKYVIAAPVGNVITEVIFATGAGIALHHITSPQKGSCGSASSNMAKSGDTVCVVSIPAGAKEGASEWLSPVLRLESAK